MNLRIAALSQNESFARSTVAAFCASCNPTIEQLSDVKTAVSEAVTNSIVHGYDGKTGTIEISARLVDRCIYLEISDDGIGIDDIEKAKKPFYTTRASDERSGMGFTVMESFMDKLEVTKRPSGGIAVAMSKNFDLKPALAE